MIILTKSQFDSHSFCLKCPDSTFCSLYIYVPNHASLEYYCPCYGCLKRPICNQRCNDRIAAYDAAETKYGKSSTLLTGFNWDNAVFIKWIITKGVLNVSDNKTI